MHVMPAKGSQPTLRARPPAQAQGLVLAIASTLLGLGSRLDPGSDACACMRLHVPARGRAWGPWAHGPWAQHGARWGLGCEGKPPLTCDDAENFSDAPLMKPCTMLVQLTLMPALPRPRQAGAGHTGSGPAAAWSADHLAAGVPPIASIAGPDTPGRRAVPSGGMHGSPRQP